MLSSAIICRSSASSPIMRSMIFRASRVLATENLSFIVSVSMLVRTPAKGLLSAHGAINVGAGNLSLLGQRVSKHRRHATMEKVQESILHMAVFRPKLVDLIAKKIRFGPPQF